MTISLFALVFELDADFSRTRTTLVTKTKERTVKLPLSFTDERLQSISTTSRNGFPSKGDSDSREYGAFAACKDRTMTSWTGLKESSTRTSIMTYKRGSMSESEGRPDSKAYQ